MLPLVPSVAHQMVHSKKFASADLSTITNVLCGAAALPPNLGQKLSKLTQGSPIAEGLHRNPYLVNFEPLADS